MRVAFTDASSAPVPEKRAMRPSDRVNIAGLARRIEKQAWRCRWDCQDWRPLRTRQALLQVS
jgi:hypothetical protein